MGMEMFDLDSRLCEVRYSAWRSDAAGAVERLDYPKDYCVDLL